MYQIKHGNNFIIYRVFIFLELKKLTIKINNHEIQNFE